MSSRDSSTSGSADAVRIESWRSEDLSLLEALLGDPEMTTYIGGPESPAKIAERHARYLRRTDPAVGPQFRIVEASGEAVGWVGYWERNWRDEIVYEIGWSVLPGFQGRGIAAAATRAAIRVARHHGRRRFVHAFPSVENGPSNAICRKLGFSLLEDLVFEYPPGHLMRCNDWRLDLHEAEASVGRTSSPS